MHTVESLGKSQIINIDQPTMYTSGIWESDNKKVKLNLTNNSSRVLKLGLFKVDPLTGSVQSSKGELISPDDTSSFHQAAYQNLEDALVTVSANSTNKQAKFSIEKDAAYATLLTWKEDGERRRLYSLPQANTDNAANLVHFGNFFYGFELNSNQKDKSDFVDLIFELDYNQ